MNQQTTGIGVPAKIAVDAAAVTLSLSGTTTHQITATAQDVGGTPQTGIALVLTAAALASGGTTVYTGTITGGASNALVGVEYTVAGFDLTANNGTFVATASSATTLTLNNASGVADTHAGTATPTDSATAFTYASYGAENVVAGTPTAVASVSAGGLITAHALGQTTVEVSYPTFDNAGGDVVNAGNVMNGLPINKIFKEITVTVTP